MRIKTSLIALVAGIFLFSSCKVKNSMEKELVLNTPHEKASYSIGINIGQNFKSEGLDSLDIDILARAIKDVMESRDLAIDESEAQIIIQEYVANLQGQRSQQQQQEGNTFLEENKNKEGVKTTESGLQYKVIKEGTGASPVATDQVTVHYTGRLIDGTIFDSSKQRGEPATFPLNGVIPGWTEGLQLMKEGGVYEFYIPPHLAYGDRGAGNVIPPNSTLVFEVELLKVGE
jgi:FKBP-type peptidyl-prolyl cis-trans isomerase